ncbi:PAS domain S-box-containing protein [Desulfonatronum thiosulfatophilum]|uniref:histidine kinase n=1 Tax=Desulfonatronum thiosulfatophilum TaxID=617002 RepID=A0A1G6DXD1_9BACT|nr:ATP-binding protein [Desulfonatronum thiosulfatophilum]SDB49435.1 PAS domain S-box-containing protein [Desulfonatronum thiosulfatophilum]
MPTLLPDQIDYPHLLQQFLESLPHAAFICSADGTILYANSEAQTTFGHVPNWFCDRSLSIFFLPEDTEIFCRNLLRLAWNKGAVNEEAMLLRRNGTRFMAMIHLRKYDHEAQPLLLLHVQDIDRQKQMENVLQELGYQDLLRVANGVGHEIRNPLLIIGGYLRKMYASCKATDEDDASYRCIVDNLRKIENIVRKIEFFTHPPKPALNSTSTEQVVEASVASLAREMRAAEVRCSIDVEPMQLLMDQGLITKVVCILLENALEILPRGGEIRVTGHCRSSWYVFSVQDNGPGIPEEHLPSIFHPFFSTKPQGAGIDLAILKRIIDNHDGQAHVLSKPGQGARFDIFLPLERRRSIRLTSIEPDQQSASAQP